MFSSFLIDRKGSIATLTLNRPDRLNALSLTVLRELAEAAAWFNSQPEIKLVILKGAGRTFSAGADLKDATVNAPQEENWVARRDKGQVGYRMTQAIENMRAITIAQVHGFAIGGAFLLMLACDFRVAEEKAFFSIPEVDLGIPLTWGGIPKLVSEIGPARTKELVMTCRRFSSREAKEMGILNQVVKAELLDETCQKLAQELTAKPIVPLLMTKEQVNAVSQHMGAAYVASAEGDMLQNAAKDPESQRAANEYLARNMKKNSKP